MKKTKRILAILLGLVLLTASMTVSYTGETRADEGTTTLEIENMQLNKARIISGSSDSGGKHVEVYWQQDTLDSFDSLSDITFARTVLNAPKSGEYDIDIHVKNDSGSSSITAMLYINGEGTEVVIEGSDYTTVTATVELDEGDNTLILAWVNWGYFDYISFSSELSVVSQSTDTLYYAFESALNEVQLTPTSSFHSASATLYTSEIVYDSGEEQWQGSATFTVDAASDIKSIDLHYYVSKYNDGEAQLAMSVNGGDEYILDLSGTKTNSELTYVISTTVLESAGFEAGSTNTIKFRQASSTGGSVGLYYIELKTDDVEETTTAAAEKKRYEAEEAYIIAGANIKTKESDDESWSNDSYVGEFTAASISSPSKIDEYCSNIGYIQYSVNVDKAGYYKVTIGYATEETMVAYVTSGYEWSKATLNSTGSWDATGEASAYVYLLKGDNSVWVTGPATEDAWVNYDYIDLSFEESGTIDTSVTVLLLDSGVSSDDSEVEEEEETTTEEDEDSDTDDDDDSSTSSSSTSPLTGSRVPAFAVILFLLAAAGAALFLQGVKNK